MLCCLAIVVVTIHSVKGGLMRYLQWSARLLLGNLVVPFGVFTLVTATALAVGSVTALAWG